MRLQHAKQLAEVIKTHLEPYCLKIAIAGSIRRQKPLVKDIEIVCIPKEIQQPKGGVLFKELECVRDPEFIAALAGLGRVTYGDPYSGKHWKVKANDARQTIFIDFFTATPETWGYILALRTGSAWFNQYRMLPGLKKRGYKVLNGVVFRNGHQVPVPAEINFLTCCGLGNISPENRDHPKL